MKKICRRYSSVFFHKETRPENVGSVGLGLNIARSIAKFHNGDIEAVSKPQEGSVFTVTLPVSRL